MFPNDQIIAFRSLQINVLTSVSDMVDNQSIIGFKMLIEVWGSFGFDLRFGVIIPGAAISFGISDFIPRD